MDDGDLVSEKGNDNEGKNLILGEFSEFKKIVVDEKEPGETSD